jgi:hypothetical protein
MQDLKEKQGNEENVSGGNRNSSTQQYGGWLAFFRICVTYISPAVWIISLFLSLAALSGPAHRSSSSVFDEQPSHSDENVAAVAALDTLGSLPIVIFGVFTGLRLKKGTQGGRKMAEWLLGVNVFWGLLKIIIAMVFYSGLPEDSVNFEAINFIAVVVISGLWFLYFVKSKRVSALFPIG